MILIREAQETDDVRVGELLVASFVATYRRRMPEVRVSDERKRDLIDVASRRIRSKVLVAELDGEVVGTVTIVPPGTPGAQSWTPDAADIRMLAVDTRFHGRGFSAKLLDSAERIVGASGAKGICVHIRRGADGLGRLYESRGYQRVPEGDLEFPSVSLLGYYRST